MEPSQSGQNNEIHKSLKSKPERIDYGRTENSEIFTL